MAPSAQNAGGRRVTRWTRELIIEKIREWNDRYGEPPCSADWNPSLARWRAQEWRAERYREGVWPSTNAAKRPFDGTFDAAVRAAGLEPHRPGPRRAGARRRGAPASRVADVAEALASGRGSPRRAPPRSSAACRRRAPRRACRGEGGRRAPPRAPCGRQAPARTAPRARARDPREPTLERRRRWSPTPRRACARPRTRPRPPPTTPTRRAASPPRPSAGRAS